ncbi:MAG: hypothetical protein KN64_13255 [Sulfurovum sp. AS07-7]|jgi:tetratricopeptide (TPR) repeat protein|nr:MAG: hypothetical protein KN64_13255 [Sulfurovum sp. AS07-7]
MRSISLVFISILFFNGCGSKAKVYTLKPAEISAMSSHKKIYIDRFDGDDIGFQEKLKTSLVELRYNKTPYFELTYGKSNALIYGRISHRIRDDVYQNQYITHFDKNGKKGERKEHKEIRPYMATKYYDFPHKDSQKNFDKKNPAPKESVEVEMCLEREVSLHGNIEIVANSKILYIYPIDKQVSKKECSYSEYPRVDTRMLLEDAQYDAIDDFIAKIAPQKVSYEIDLIDSAEKNWTKEQKNILKNAMNFIEDERYNEAQQLLVSLVNSTNRQSFVALYNLGIVLEAKAKYDEAKLIYKEASKLYSKDVGLSIEAINRITNTQKSEIEAINEIEK